MMRYDTSDDAPRLASITRIVTEPGPDYWHVVLYGGPFDGFTHDVASLVEARAWADEMGYSRKRERSSNE
jgi:hypothetical protein